VHERSRDRSGAGRAALLDPRTTDSRDAAAIVAATTGKRFSGPDALAAGIVEAITSEDQVLHTPSTSLGRT
jgi:enoyl-CoA hydratase/carnithine racemase